MKRILSLLMAAMICIGLIMVFSPKTVHAADDDIASGTYCSVDWRITAEGEMIIGDGTDQTFDYWSSRNLNSYPWRDYRGRVKSVRFDGIVHGNGSMDSMFWDFTNTETIDLSGFETSHVTNMGMFNGCSSLKSLDLSGFDTSSATSMGYMFYNCSSLTSLDVSGFDTSNVTYMGNMFNGCKGLTSLDLSGFDTSNVTNMERMFSYCSALTTLDLSGFDTGNVSSMRMMFAVCSQLAFLDISSFDTSNATNLQDMFSNASSMSTIVLGKDFYFKGASISSSTYWAKLPLPLGTGTTGKWIRDDGAFGPYSNEDLTIEYTSEMAGTWVWQTNDYTIVFSGGDIGSGAMPNVKTTSTLAFVIPKNKYYAYGYDFDHWVDDRGRTYQDEGTIPARRYSAGSTVTLTAVFKKRDTSVQMEDGSFTFDIKAGEKATFNDIPAGTSYQVYELTPDGWVLVQQENASGVIEALEESAAKFWNQYQPGITTVQFSGLKTLDGHPASEGSYTFELLENGEVIDTATTLDGGFIQFKVIEYDAAGDHVYTIREVDPGDDAIDYDMHEETVNVTVTDNGDGTLSSEVTYDADGIVFQNSTRPGTLRITKNANVTETNKDDTFTFEITFSNENGMPISDDIYWYIEDQN